jgi:hypothetical protein
MTVMKNRGNKACEVFLLYGLPIWDRLPETIWLILTMMHVILWLQFELEYQGSPQDTINSGINPAGVRF